MKLQNLIDKKVGIAEKRIQELLKSGDLKKLSEKESYQISQFYEIRTINRLKTAELIYKVSGDLKIKTLIKIPQTYMDYGEAVAVAYYAMYYIVHAYLAKEYKTKLREGIRGVHAITQNIILYYLVKTKKLAQHLFQEYIKTFETTAQIQKLDVEDFQEEAYKYVKKYDKSRDARELFTYKVTPEIESYHAKNTIKTANEFINTIRQLMLSK